MSWTSGEGASPSACCWPSRSQPRCRLMRSTFYAAFSLSASYRHFSFCWASRSWRDCCSNGGAAKSRFTLICIGLPRLPSVWFLSGLSFASSRCRTCNWGRRFTQRWRAYDYSVRSPFISSALRTGAPPANPFFYPGHSVPARYYYYWNVLCALPAFISRGSARVTLYASCIWSGLLLAAMIPIYLKHFLEQSSKLRVVISRRDCNACGDRPGFDSDTSDYCLWTFSSACRHGMVGYLSDHFMAGCVDMGTASRSGAGGLPGGVFVSLEGRAQSRLLDADLVALRLLRSASPVPLGFRFTSRLPSGYSSSHGWHTCCCEASFPPRFSMALPAPSPSCSPSVTFEIFLALERARVGLSGASGHFVAFALRELPVVFDFHNNLGSVLPLGSACLPHSFS